MSNKGKSWKALVTMPGYGHVTGGASMGFWRASKTHGQVMWQYQEGSLLANNFNRLWCQALNVRHKGEQLDYFAMQHADVEPEPFWLDAMIEELERHNLDVLGAVVPIKDGNGLTSLALHDDGNNWRAKCRLTMTEAFRLPETFTSEDVGSPLLLNTGLWVCRMGDWCKKVRFTINDRIVYDEKTDQYHAEVEPEDWYFSRLLHELNLRIGATRKVRLIHRGTSPFVNYITWGNSYDKAYVNESQIPVREDEPYYKTIEGYFDWEHLYDDVVEQLPEDGQFVEVGTWRGKSLAYLLSQLSERGKAVKVWGVDHYEGSPEACNLQQMARLHDIYAECQKNLEPIGYPFKLIREKSVGAAEQFADGSLDGIFIDGGHQYEDIVADLRAWMPKLKPGGILAGHDLQMAGVKRALDEVLPDKVEPLPRPAERGGFEWGLAWRAKA